MTWSRNRKAQLDSSLADSSSGCHVCAGVLELDGASKSLWGWSQPRSRGPTPRASDSESLGWRLRFCISSTFPGGTALADSATELAHQRQANNSAHPTFPTPSAEGRRLLLCWLSWAPAAYPPHPRGPEPLWHRTQTSLQSRAGASFAAGRQVSPGSKGQETDCLRLRYLA